LLYFRPSSLSLSKAVQDGITALKEKCIDYGLLTTPQLHYIVSCYNAGNQSVNEDSYYLYFSSAFQSLVKQVRLSWYLGPVYTWHTLTGIKLNNN